MLYKAATGYDVYPIIDLTKSGKFQLCLQYVQRIAFYGSQRDNRVISWQGMIVAT